MAGPEKQTGETPVRIGALKTEADWLAVRERIEKLERLCAPNPWATWDHYFEVTRHFLPGRACWLIEIPRSSAAPDDLLAAAVWLEDRTKRQGMTYQILRSLDMTAMQMPPFWMPRGFEEEACNAMAEALPEIARVTKCHLVSLYRQQAGPADRWAGALERRGVAFRKKLFTNSISFAYPATFDEYLETTGRRKKKNHHSCLRRIEKNFGQPAEMIHLAGDIFQDSRMEQLWPEFEKLREISWQYQEARRTKSVDTGVLTLYYRDIARRWSRKGWADFWILKIGGKALAGSFDVFIGDRLYGLLLAYDQEYGKFSVGTILFYVALEESHRRGDRWLELGGEGSDWKQDWSLGTEPVYELEWALGGWKARLWSLAARFKKQEGNQPVR